MFHMKNKIPILKMPKAKSFMKGTTNRTRVLMVKLNEQEYELIRRMAQASGVAMARLLRETALRVSNLDKISVGMNL